MPKMKVSTRFGGKDELSPVFKRMGRSAGKFGKRSSRSFKNASKAALGFKNITKGILAAGAISKGIGLLGRGATVAATGFLDFDQAITSASAKFSGLDLTTKAGQKTLQDLRKTARQVGKDTEFGADQAASGLDFLALAGFNAEQAMSLIPGVANLATVANIDLAQATDIASDSLGAFGLMTKDSTKLATNFTRVQDVMAKTTATSNTNLVDLFESVKKGAPAFTAAGQSLETFSALTGVMANSGVKGAEAGTQLRNVMLRLAKPTKEAQQVLDKLGVTTSDSKGNFVDVIDVLADFEKGLKGMGTKQKSAALATVFGARSVTGINILLKEGTQQLRSYRQSLIDSAGSAKQMATIMRSSLLNRLKSLGSALMDVGFQFFEAFKKKGANAVDTLTQFVRKINLAPFIALVKQGGAFFSNWFQNIKKLAGEVGLFDKLRTAMGNLKPVFTTLQDIFTTLTEFAVESGLLNTLIDIVSLFGSAFVGAWKVIKPVLKLISEALKPIIERVGEAVRGLEKIFGAKKNKEEEALSEKKRKRAIQDAKKFATLKTVAEKIAFGKEQAAFARSLEKKPVGRVAKIEAKNEGKKRADSFIESGFKGLIAGAGSAGRLFDKLTGNQLQPPNQAEAQAKSNIGIGIQTNITAPKGTTAETTAKTTRDVNKSAIGSNTLAFAQ